MATKSELKALAREFVDLFEKSAMLTSRPLRDQRILVHQVRNELLGLEKTINEEEARNGS